MNAIKKDAKLCNIEHKIEQISTLLNIIIEHFELDTEISELSIEEAAARATNLPKIYTTLTVVEELLIDVKKDVQEVHSN